MGVDRRGIFLVAGALACLALGACDNRSPPKQANQAAHEPPPAPAATETADNAEQAEAAGPSASVMRPAVVAEAEKTQPPPPPEPFEATIPFDYDGSKLDDATKAALAPVVAAALKSPDAPITIRGSTDSKGDDKTNRRISLERADAVRDYLASQGVAKERMTTIGLGETRPIAPNANLDGSDNPEGRRKNRRVDIVVAAPSAATAPAAEPSADMTVIDKPSE